MATFKDLIDDILERLNDDGTLFSRVEILRWLSEGYRRLTNQARHAKTFTALDIPPRHGAAYTQPWEKRADITSRKWTFTHQNGFSECTFLWEAQQADGVATSPHLRSVSQLWELSSTDAGQADALYRFSLPRNEAVVHTVWHDHERLTPSTVRILDSLEDRWWAVNGEPFQWAQNLGEANDFDIYETVTTYQQSYDHREASQGAPRALSGTRSYTVDSAVSSWDYAYSWDGEPSAPATQLSGIGRRFTFGPQRDLVGGPSGEFFYTHDWEGQQHRGETITASTAIAETNPFRYDPEVDPPVESITANLELGVFRRASSSDRQYWPSHQWNTLGIARTWGSSDDNILVYHSVSSEDILFEEFETPMIPAQAQKYLIYYVLAVLFNRQGEGYDPAMAEHYSLRANRGVVLMRKLGNVTRMAETYLRGARGRKPKSRTALPQLPSNFPRAPWLR